MPFDDLADQLESLQQQHRYRNLVPRRCDGMTLVEPDGRSLVNFGSNDYLGIAADPFFARNFSGSASPDGTRPGSMASSLVCGWTDRHQFLADSIADLESSESAAVFPSGYAACSGVIATLARADDLILSDALNHASLIDGCRLSRAQCIVYPHRDTEAVERYLTEQRDRYQRVWIVTDTVFSMDGHVAPLQKLSDLAARHEAELIVDEAHATGVLGDTGAGLCEELGLQERISVRIGTLSKAVGAQGGFVVGPNIIVDYLINHCRTLIFSTALAPPVVENAIRSLEVIKVDSARRSRVRLLARGLRKAMGVKAPGIEGDIPIIPVATGSENKTLVASREMRDAGLYVPAIRPPTVPEGSSRLRISLSAAHDEQQIEQLVDACKSALA